MRRKKRSPAFKIFFLHIPKTAGTSFVDTLRGWFPKADRANYIEGLPGEARGQLGAKSFVSGHLFWDEVHRLPCMGERRLISVFRDPYARLASHLRYMDRYSQPDYRDGFDAFDDDMKAIVERISKLDFERPSDLESFFSDLSGWGRAAFDNSQTRFMTCDPGSEACSPYGALSDGAIDLALERLEALDMIGISEDLRTTIERLALQIRLQPPARIARSNTRSSVRKLDHRDPAIRAAMAPLVRFDERLYARARTLFQQRAALQPAGGVQALGDWGGDPRASQRVSP
ncbi:hypothetical protein [Caulobacter endophyticus]|uniref:hypothetical protein n=1 Tax=Caulobacter endophyticus TaxID=2172652 RepID=UPI00240F695B|nr:hypothetical protein [Caulobacter endophyticus]MDG2528785.1 hypothetical protein [Caulobacter endophyticus]